MTQINTASMNIQSSPIQHIKRINELDFLKCIGIILVVIGHVDCPQKLHDLIYYVHMPLFFMLSGCTNKEDQYYASVGNLKAFFIKRIKSIYLPFLYYSLPIILLHNVFYNLGMYSSGYTLTQYLLQIGRTLLFSMGITEPLLSQFWFLKALFFAEVFYAILVFISFKFKISKWYILMPISFFVLYLDLDKLPHFLSVNLFVPFRAMAYFILGGYLFFHKEKVLNSKLTLFLSFVGCIYWIYSSLDLSSSYPKATFISIQNVYSIFSLKQAYFTLSVFIVLWQFASIIKNFSFYNFLLAVGQLTLPIFALHFLYIQLLSYIFALVIYNDLSILPQKLCLDAIPWYIYTLVSIAFSILTYKVVIYFKRTALKSIGQK